MKKPLELMAKVVELKSFMVRVHWIAIFHKIKRRMFRYVTYPHNEFNSAFRLLLTDIKMLIMPCSVMQIATTEGSDVEPEGEAELSSVVASM